MKLRTFRITMYKGVIDSGTINVEALTVIVGKNEAGKTTLLRALHKLNPATPEPYNIDREWPRGKRRDRRPDQVVCHAIFSLDDEEITYLSTLTDQAESFNAVEITRDYAGHLEVIFPNGLFTSRLHPNEIDRHHSTLPTIPSDVTPTFREVATKQIEEIRRLAFEGRFSDLAALHSKYISALQVVAAQAGQPSHTAEQQFLSQYTGNLQQLPAKLKQIPSIQKQAHEYIIQRLPKFIYMSDYRIFQGRAFLNQVKERREKTKLTDADETFLMILSLSGLDLLDLFTKGGTDDREQRQYDLDDGGKTLTASFKERFKQREYKIEFRADGQEFFTMVTDNRDAALIRLDERSKGFQWFFSFDMLFMHESGGTFQNCVLLLDEPGLHLHPGAQHDLLRRFEDYARGNTLIYSTHLPFMIDLRQPERIRVINDGPSGTMVTEDLTNTPPEAKLTLQAALGMSGSQSYLIAQRNLIVEGADDFMLLVELSNLLIRSNEEGLPEDVHVTAGGGASEAAYVATFMIGQDLDVVVLLDSDSAGEQAKTKLVTTWLTRYKGCRAIVLSLGPAAEFPNGEFAIEDLFDEEFYLEHVKETYSKALTAAGATDLKLIGTGQLCKRVERALAPYNIAYNKGSVAKRIRGSLLRMKGVDQLSVTTTQRIRAVFQTVRSSFTQMKGDSRS